MIDFSQKCCLLYLRVVLQGFDNLFRCLHDLHLGVMVPFFQITDENLILFSHPQLLLFMSFVTFFKLFFQCFKPTLPIIYLCIECRNDPVFICQLFCMWNFHFFDYRLQISFYLFTLHLLLSTDCINFIIFLLYCRFQLIIQSFMFLLENFLLLSKRPRQAFALWFFILNNLLQFSYLCFESFLFFAETDSDGSELHLQWRTLIFQNISISGQVVYHLLKLANLILLVDGNQRWRYRVDLRMIWKSFHKLICWKSGRTIISDDVCLS